ncbi:unnamed protein product [Pocillopora meandrina]|uniref:Serine-threonine/tyrosine-protein kinase catalytic domain-containing protein n=1 Tax=Pocillopora meandrina TaxID=46732 RepID=A0AAU9XV52_9CNID|nr:unnamed protein product [Pocillopora meandrina]
MVLYELFSGLQKVTWLLFFSVFLFCWCEVISVRSGSPYPRMNGRKIANLHQEGYRMHKPQHVDDKLYDIMAKCWKDKPTLRPSFEKLRNKLKEMENRHKGLINLKNYDDRLYVNIDDLAV